LAKNCLVFITVLIGQLDQFQGHTHAITGNATAGENWGNPSPIAEGNSRGSYRVLSASYPTAYNNGEPRVGSETRPANLSIKIWQRIS
jgi:hypothetical protein